MLIANEHCKYKEAVEIFKQKPFELSALEYVLQTQILRQIQSDMVKSRARGNRFPAKLPNYLEVSYRLKNQEVIKFDSLRLCNKVITLSSESCTTFGKR